MAHIRPFAAIRYVSRDGNISSRIAPPYDVLDEARKQQLLQQDAHNIVKVDLPYTPPKVAGPDEVYTQANATLQQWLADGVIAPDRRAGFYPYMQSYDHAGKTIHRRGFFALVKLSPFGQGEIVPHEKTYDGPIEDRLKLMRATRMQLSPIFGLFSDPAGEVNRLLYAEVSRPDASGEMQGVSNRLWSVIDAGIEAQVMDLMRDKPIYIADGHHRYTTALAYQRELQQQAPLPEHHPANYCLFVLIPMQDPGLLIHGTHRLVGGLSGFSIDVLKRKLGQNFEIVETPLRGDHVDEFAETLPGYPPHTFGLYDHATRKLYTLTLKNVDVLASVEPDHSPAWRQLDVAILQRYLLDEIIGPSFAGGQKISPGYTADPHAIIPMMEKGGYQIALLVQPTPLQALEQLGRTKEVMPQKSTYFFPKLATGMVMASLA